MISRPCDGLNNMNSEEAMIEAILPILGLWKTSGRVLSPSGEPEIEITGTDEYELMIGGRWVMHRVDVMMGVQQVQALEMIGQPDDDRALRMRAFDASGGYDEMKLSLLDDGVMLLEGEGIRSTLRVAADETSMEALWERELDGGWIRWMEMSFEKIADMNTQPA